MPKPSRLRAVSEGETASAPTTIVEAVRTGTVRQQLAMMRERLARQLDDPNCPPVPMAALSKRLMELTKEIEMIDARAAEEGGAVVRSDDESWQAV